MKSPSASRSSLSHWMTVRSSMVAFSMGTMVDTGSCPSTKPPGWIERWRGKSWSASASSRSIRGRRRAWVEAGLADQLGREAVVVVREQLGERDRAWSRRGRAPCPRRAAPSAAVADDVRDHRRVAAPVLRVDVLDDLLAPLVLEVEVDVGRLGALLREEALEEEPHPHRIDRGDAEAVADRRVRGRAAALAEDVLLAAELDDLAHGEEVAAVVELLDERELFVELRAHVRRQRRRRSDPSRLRR